VRLVRRFHTGLAHRNVATAHRADGGRARCVESLGLGHEHGLFEAGCDREKRRYLTALLNAFETPERFQRWMQEALAATASGEQGA
jgi:hypothetical protein